MNVMQSFLSVELVYCVLASFLLAVFVSCIIWGQLCITAKVSLENGSLKAFE